MKNRNLLEILKLKTSSFESLSNKSWSVFNLFLTFNLAFLTFYFSREENSYFGKILPYFGLTISILWTFLGANDYKSLKKHKKIKEKLEESYFRKNKINKIINIDNHKEKNIPLRSQSKNLFIIPSIVIALWATLIIIKII